MKLLILFLSLFLLTACSQAVYAPLAKKDKLGGGITASLEDKAKIISLIAKYDYTKTYDFKTAKIADLKANTSLMTQQDHFDLIALYNKYLAGQELTDVKGGISDYLNNELLTLSK